MTATLPWDRVVHQAAVDLDAQIQAGTLKLRPGLLPHQRPPEDIDWSLWLLEAGRGAGKTEACARYFSQKMREHPGSRGRIIAPTKDDAVDACVNGPSGLKSVDDQVEFYPSRSGGMIVEWPNGSIARVLGMDSPKDVDRLRAGGNRDLDWWEEMAAIRHLDDAWKQAKFGLRGGGKSTIRPHSIASTTPKNTPAYREIRALPGTRIVKASMYDNPYLPPEFIAEIEAQYANTRTGRQEVHGDLLEDVEGAFWSLEMLATVQWRGKLPPFEVVVTSVDPSGSSTGDATGIITVAATPDGIPFVIADDTTKGSPEHRYQTAVMAAHRHGASVLLYEDNYGGDNVASNLRSAWQAAQRRGEIPGDDDMPRLLATSKMNPRLKGGKADRASVIAALYEQHAAGSDRVYHAPGLAALEEEMTTWEETATWSPNRMDAAVWGIRYHTRHLGREHRPAETSALETFRRGLTPNGSSPFGPSRRLR